MNKKSLITVALSIVSFLSGAVFILIAGWHARYILVNRLIPIVPAKQMASDNQSIQLKKGNDSIQLISGEEIYADIWDDGISFNGRYWGVWIYYDEHGEFARMEISNLQKERTVMEIDSGLSVRYGAAQYKVDNCNREFYCDIDGNGIFDTKTDKLSSESCIWIDKQWFEADLIKDRDALHALLKGQGSKMIFESGRWETQSSN